MRVWERTGLVTALLFAAAGAAEAKGPPKTISVDCSRGQTIGDALSTPAGALVIEFSGTCAEDVVIERDDVTLSGATPAASITGAVSALSPAPAVVVRGAQRVTLRGFAARDSDHRGIQIEQGAAVRIDSLAVDGNVGAGLIVLSGSYALVRNSSFDGNGSDGVGAWRNSSIELEGTVRSNGNGRAGFIISGGSDLSVMPAGAAIVANDNSASGFALQLTASAQLSARSEVTVLAERNRIGLSLFLDSSFGASQGSMIVRESQTGITMTAASASLTGLEVSGCQLGVYANLESMLDLTGARVTGNDRGVLVEAATALLRGGSIITGNTTEDLRLVFGSRVRFQGGTGGNISCDGTVLVRGDASCPASSSQKIVLSSNDDGLLGASNEGFPGETRPFPLIP